MRSDVEAYTKALIERETQEVKGGRLAIVRVHFNESRIERELKDSTLAEVLETAKETIQSNLVGRYLGLEIESVEFVGWDQLPAAPDLKADE